MEYRKDNQLIKRISELAQQNKELSLELRALQELYEELLKKQVEYEDVLAMHPNFREIKDVLTSGKEQSLKFTMTTVLFADIYGFAEILPEVDEISTIDHLDHLFLQFDQILQKYPIIKIHTIGDSYMCAGGIPNKNITNPIEVVQAAFEMLQLVKELSKLHNKNYDIRLAIHTGPVTAFANGKTKVNYDIKGDTVNIATRMESAGVNGKLLISVMTYELIKEFFDCEYFGKLPVKYKGLLDIYEVIGIKPELSVNQEGIYPNSLFVTRFELIRFHDLQEEILDLLEKELPVDLYYHNLKHTVDVVTEVELIGWAEGITDDDMLVIKTAALFHDVGHIVTYDGHEHQGTEIARTILPGYGYSEEQIGRICQVIMATKMPPKPQNLLEEIICDSDLDYLGRTDFIPVSNTLYEELKVRDKVGSFNDWNKLQLLFISKHQYFTQTARKLREVNKQNQIERIKQIIE